MNIIFLQPQIDCDLSPYSLQEAVNQMEANGADKPFRLLASSVYGDGDILQIIMKVSGKLEIPFDRCHALPLHSWILIDTRGAVLFYSPGA